MGSRREEEEVMARIVEWVIRNSGMGKLGKMTVIIKPSVTLAKSFSTAIHCACAFRSDS